MNALRPHRHRHLKIQSLKNTWRIQMNAPYFWGRLLRGNGFFYSFNGINANQLHRWMRERAGH